MEVEICMFLFNCATGGNGKKGQKSNSDKMYQTPAIDRAPTWVLATAWVLELGTACVSIYTGP